METHRLTNRNSYLDNYYDDNDSSEIIYDNDILSLETVFNNEDSNKTKKHAKNDNNSEKKMKEKKELPDICLNYVDYKKENVNLNKYKLDELKSICKKHKLLITGTKKGLIEKLLSYFKQIESSIIIQKYFRRYIVFWSLRKRGPAFKNHKLCVNETDGYTLEPLEEIPKERFFSYMDSKGFIYGFDIVTLYNTVHKNPNKSVNPYTRELFGETVVKDIIFIFNSIKILFENVFTREEKESIFIKKHIEVLQTNNRRPRNWRHGNNNNNDNTLGINYNEPLYFGMHYLAHLNLQQKEILDKIILSRNHSLERRIEDIISEINQLGNYASSRWILELNQSKIFTFIRVLRNIWDIRFGISNTLKKDICQFGDPFSILHLGTLSIYRFDIPQIINSTIDLIYYFVLCGVDIESRRLGALYILTALTSVSIDARNNMPWLFETIS